MSSRIEQVDQPGPHVSVSIQAENGTPLDWRASADPITGLSAAKFSAVELMEATRRFAEGKGMATLLQCFKNEGVGSDDNNSLNIQQRRATYGTFAGIIFLEAGGKRVAVNVPLDSAIRSQVVRDDARLMNEVCQYIPEHTGPVYALEEIPVNGQPIPASFSHGFLQVEEINWRDGIFPQRNRQLPVTILHNKTPEGQGSQRATPQETYETLCAMQEVVTKLFVRSNEHIVVATKVNNGDFIRTGEDADLVDPSHAIKLITARGNVLKPQDYAYTQLPGADRRSISTIFQLWDQLRHEPTLIGQIAQALGRSPTDGAAALRGLGKFSNDLSPRQIFFLTELLDYEYEVVLGRGQIQSWPVEVLYNGTTTALRNEGYAEVDIQRWWSKGPDAPVVMFDRLATLLEHPVNSATIGTFGGTTWFAPSVSSRCRRLTEYIAKQ